MIALPDIERAVEKVVALYAPERVYLFGSYAKGTATDRSDLDLLVVRASELPRYLRGNDVVAVVRELPFPVDLIFVTPQELQDSLADPYSFYATVMDAATVMYERQG